MLKRLLSIYMDIELPRKPLLVVLGATGTGKSQLAIDLAKRFDGEVINGDAMQMYAGFPIITNKITPTERQGIPHHLLGHIEIDEEAWRVGVFQRAATNLINQIRERGKVPVLVGGTHYYIQSLLFGDSIIGTNEKDEDDYKNLPSNLQASGDFSILDGSPDLILEKLREVDPVMAGRWHPNDQRKIRRSLEIYLQTGERASDLYEKQQNRKDIRARNISKMGSMSESLSPESTLIFWIYTEPEILKKRLDARVFKMIEDGLLDEVKSLNDYLENREASGLGIDMTRGIWASIGWKEFEPFLKALKTGKDLGSALELSIQQTQAATRQYAKRQLRWIRLKLRPALAQNHKWNCRLYLLDNNDACYFQENVSKPAIRIATDLVAGKNLQPPQEISIVAKNILDQRESKPDVWFRKTCNICLMTAMNEIEWESHVNSRKHRAMMKKSLINKENQIHLESRNRDLPIPNTC